MIIPLLTPLPPPPLPTDPESVFDSKAGATLSAQKTLVDEMNVNVIPAFNATAVQVNSDADDAAQAAADASQDRSEALTYKNAAQTAATNASGSATAANTSRQQAQAAAISAAEDALRAEDAADRAEAIVGPIGTAASRDVQTSPTDTTPGRLMAVGAFGLGGAAVANAGNLNTALTSTQFFTTLVDTTNVPIGQGTSSGQGYGIHIQHPNSAYAYQTWTQLSSLRRFERLNVAGTWSAWQELYHTGNWYLGTDKQQTSNATGAVTLNLANVSIFDLTLTGNTTLTVSNASVPSGETRSVVVRVRQGATARTLTWWPGITWLAATTPAAPGANKVVEYVLSYSAAGWIGRVGAKN